MPRRYSLRWHLFLMCLLVLAPLALAGGYGAWSYISDQQRILEARAFGIARAAVEASELEIQKYLVALETVASSPSVEQGDAAKLYTIGAKTAGLLKAEAFSASEVTGTLIFTTALPFGSLPNLAASPEFVASHRAAVEKGTVNISDVFFTRVNHVPVVAIDKPVPFQRRTIVLSLGFPVALFPNIIKSRSGVSDWLFSITGKDLRIIYRSWDEKYVGGAPTQAFIENTKGQSGSFVSTTLEGERVLNVYMKAPTTGWIIGAAIPISQYNAPLYRAIAFLAGSMVLALTVSLAAALLYARRIARPVEGLRAFALGNAGPMPASGISELDAVSGALLEHARMQRTLIDELNHRVKNTLSIVQALPLLTRRHAKTPDEFTDTFDDRLLALAKSHNLLSRTNWTHCELRDLLLDCCSGFSDQSRLALAGDRIILTPNAAVKLCMVFHELATNATKHGAFKTQTGTVDVSWSLARQTFALLWVESGVAVAAADNRGFGSILVKALVERDLSGKLTVVAEPTGLEIHIDVPADRVIASLLPAVTAEIAVTRPGPPVDTAVEATA